MAVGFRANAGETENEEEGNKKKHHGCLSATTKALVFFFSSFPFFFCGDPSSFSKQNLQSVCHGSGSMSTTRLYQMQRSVPANLKNSFYTCLNPNYQLKKKKENKETKAWWIGMEEAINFDLKAEYST